ncbi:DUF817 domain-containing protein [Kingella potus]|uniref:DUF817 domain-containing protein n=1 Tax=Kingella potus TaxID=265175 RepID=UPI001FCFA3C2|nr:DUF817 domain-containing protein [Kingella potus]UOP00223.1 DUF817 domain-containing protein [Kingella potus]
MQPLTQNRLDAWLTRHPPRPQLRGLSRFAVEFWFFGLKEARACLFAGLFFLTVFAVPRGGWFGIARYDILLLAALAMQAAMLLFKLETRDEVKAITLFHIVGFALELFKTSSAAGSWSYPEPAWSKIGGVPLFAGFMYAAVGSYIIQAWRLFGLKIKSHPPHLLAALCSLLIYANFFTHHYIGDYRWYLAAFALGLYARTAVLFTPYDTERRMPLLLAFVLIGFFIWLAENAATFAGLWRYPNQIGAWSVPCTSANGARGRCW